MQHFALLARLDPVTSLFVLPTFQGQQRTGKLPHMLRGMQGIVANNCPAKLRKRQRYQLHGNPFLKQFKQYISLIKKVNFIPATTNLPLGLSLVIDGKPLHERLARAVTHTITDLIEPQSEQLDNGRGLGYQPQ